MKKRIIIIGAGITGSSIAYELSKYDCQVVLLEERNDVSMVTTKANSGIVHAGYDPLPNTLMARLNVEGNELIRKLAKELNIHCKNTGSLVIGRNDKDRALIEKLLARGIENKVPGLRIVEKEELHKMEPCLNEDVECALYAPTACVIAPWELGLALATNAVVNGVELVRNAKVTAISKENDEFVVETTQGKFTADYCFNAAGLHADDVYQLIAPNAVDSFKITPVKGEYYLLDKSQGKLANMVLFQTPNELGKGVLVSPTVHGNLIVGPNASSDVLSKEDVSTTKEALDYIRNAASLTTTKINYRDNIRNFSGNRANILGREDFLIEESKAVAHFFNFAGIKSPGLTSGPAMGIEAVRLLEGTGLKLEKKEKHIVYPLPKYFKDMTAEEINEMIKKDPRYGRIICRCETISEGEIVAATHQPIPPISIDGVKRRTNAGMGRCQGGFCGPKVVEILSRELGLKPYEILQDGNGSNIVLGITKGESF